MSAVADFAEAFLQIHLENGLSSSSRFDIGVLSLEESYEVQRRVIAARVARGEHVAGYSLSCTSRPIRQQLGMTDPASGRILAPHVYYGDTELDCRDYTHCCITPEFVLRLARDVEKEFDSEKELCEAIEWVAPGIAVHRHRFWFGKPTLQELIAANGLLAELIVGQQRVPACDLDLELEGVGVFRNGELVASGIGAEVLGGPLKALRWLASHLLRRGEHLKAGQLVLPGSAVPLVPVERGDKSTAAFTRLGSVTATFGA